MQTSHSQVSPSSNPLQLHSTIQTNSTGDTFLGLFGISLLGCLVLGAVLYRKHRDRRAVVLRQQIEMLEKLWRISPNRID